MSLRLVLIFFALLAMVCAQPTPGAPEVTESKYGPAFEIFYITFIL